MKTIPVETFVQRAADALTNEATPLNVANAIGAMRVAIATIEAARIGVVPGAMLDLDGVAIGKPSAP